MNDTEFDLWKENKKLSNHLNAALILLNVYRNEVYTEGSNLPLHSHTNISTGEQHYAKAIGKGQDSTAVPTTGTRT